MHFARSHSHGFLNGSRASSWFNANGVTALVPPGVFLSAGPSTRHDRTRILLVEPSHSLHRGFGRFAFVP